MGWKNDVVTGKCPVVRVNVDEACQVELVFTKSGESETLTAAGVHGLREQIKSLSLEIERLKDELSCLPWNEVLTKAGVRRISATADSSFVKMYCLQHGLDLWTHKTMGPMVRGIPSRLASDFTEQYRRFEKADGSVKRAKAAGDSPDIEEHDSSKGP